MKPKRDAYQEITDRMIELIESGQATGDWQQPWRAAAGAGLPENAVTHRKYRGVNVMVLWGAAIDRGYEHNLWASYRQWKSIGAQVRKRRDDDERLSEHVIFWRKITKYDPDDERADDEGKVTFLVERLTPVFNVAEVEGFELPETEPDLPHERHDDCDRFVASTGADVRHNAGRAYYDKQRDYVSLPRIGLFESPEHYYSVALHELTHWTGHKQRADRDLTGRFGDESYAMEELVAELGATFMSGAFGLEPQLREDHVEYVAHWLTVMRGDKKAIVTAAAKAGDAAEFLYEAAGYDPAAVETAVA